MSRSRGGVGVEEGVEDGLGGGVGVQGGGLDLLDEVGEVWVGGDDEVSFLVDCVPDDFEELLLAAFAPSPGQEPRLLCNSLVLAYGVDQLVYSYILDSPGGQDPGNPFPRTGVPADDGGDVSDDGVGAGRSALLTTKRSAISMRPAFMACMASPPSGTRATMTVSARPMISSSACPTPTVSTMVTSVP